jgi:hypothetical protein
VQDAGRDRGGEHALFGGRGAPGPGEGGHGPTFSTRGRPDIREGP